MKFRRKWGGLLVAALAIVVALGLIASGTSAQTGPPAYQDPSLPVEQRVEDLLSRMTLEEKVGQMTQINVQVLMGDPSTPWDRGPLNPDLMAEVFDGSMTGSILSGGGASPLPNSPSSWAEMTNAIQQYAIEHSRLGIPIIYGADAVHGHNNVLGATFFPHQFGLGATFDPRLVERLAARTARAVRATGVHWNFAPVADLWRDLRWGRSYEPYSEDPFTAGELVAASIRGQQGDDLAAEDRVVATLKHFFGYSAPDSGRDRENATLTPRELADEHLPPFEAAVAAGGGTAMANSGSVNGVPVHASQEFLTGVLRDQLGFEGPLLSDWEDIIKLVTVHEFAPTYEDAIVMAIEAGIDMSMVPLDAPGFTSRLIALVNDGRVPMERIDEAVGRILTLKFELGLFERPYVDPAAADAIVLGADRRLARRSAARTMTLLENDGTLPLRRRGADVLVTGPSADSMPNQLGGWSIGWQGATDPSEAPEVTTIREGVEDAVRRGRVRYTPGVPPDTSDPDAVEAARAEAVRLAGRAETVVIAVGEPPYAETPGDTETAELPAVQSELLDALEETGTPVVLVVIAGRPLMMADQIDGAAATLFAYLPGTEAGSAVADTLFGRVNPSGRLSFTWPRSVDQAPLTHDRLPGEPYDPLYPFGYGQSYTRFAYTRLDAPRYAAGDETVEVTVDVANKGKRAGRETVLLFASRKQPSASFPVQKLVAFGHVLLRPRERRQVRLSFPVERLAVTGASGEKAVQPGRYVLSAGKRKLALKID